MALGAGHLAAQALQIHGGDGCTRTLALERQVRDGRILRVHESSSDIQRTIIARPLLG